MILEINESRENGRINQNVTAKQQKSWKNRVEYLTKCLHVLTEVPDPEKVLKGQRKKYQDIYDKAKQTYIDKDPEMQPYWDSEVGELITPFIALGKFHKATGMGKVRQQLLTIKFLLSSK